MTRKEGKLNASPPNPQRFEEPLASSPSLAAQSHRVQQDRHLHAPSKSTLRDFPTVNRSLFYSQESRFASVCNPSTSVKYFYKLHSPALRGKKIFLLSIVWIIHGRCIQ